MHDYLPHAKAFSSQYKPQCNGILNNIVSPALKVVIDISYTPPEEGYQPPYYRAASTVTLTCRAVGTSGQIRYLWTSTCGSCFVPSGYDYSYSGYSRSQNMLVSRDAGNHTCSAYHTSQRISGSASTVMNIEGEHFLYSLQTIECSQVCIQMLYLKLT